MLFSELTLERQEFCFDAALSGALKGGAEILEVYPRQDVGEIQKGDGSPLTEADERAHLAIVAALKSTGLPVLSEEGKKLPAAERRQWGAFWMVDPLDGTKEFIKKNGEFTVNIALIENGEPLFGVVYVPVKKWLYVGQSTQESAQAFRLDSVEADSRLKWSDLTHSGSSLPLRQSTRPFRVVGSRSHLSEETKAYVEALRKRQPELEMISMGSSLKLCLVAEGSADIYPRFAPTMEWDTAAGDAIARAAGRLVLQYDPESGEKGPVAYNKENLLNPWFIVRSDESGS